MAIVSDILDHFRMNESVAHSLWPTRSTEQTNQISHGSARLPEPGSKASWSIARGAFRGFMTMLTGWWLETLWTISVSWDDFSQYGKTKNVTNQQSAHICVKHQIGWSSIYLNGFPSFPIAFLWVFHPVSPFAKGPKCGHYLQEQGQPALPPGPHSSMGFSNENICKHGEKAAQI